LAVEKLLVVMKEVSGDSSGGVVGYDTVL
jgi:hypothetical protein